VRQRRLTRIVLLLHARLTTVSMNAVALKLAAMTT